MNPFILPKRSTPDDLEAEYDHKEFKQWISDLPIGNVGKTARSLHQEINRHNGLEMSPLERFEALQLMLPALGFVREGLWSHYATKTFPLSNKSRVIARLHLELLVGTVIAYKTVMSQFHDDSFTGHLLHRRTRSESARYALYFLAEILVHEYSLYRVSPKFVWRELHGIYHYTVINDLRRKEIEVTDDDAAGDMTIDDIYKRILLLALTDPNGLLRGEITRISDALIDWLPEVSLVPVNQEASYPCAFIVDATKDAPPYVADTADKQRIKIGWFLLTDRLDEILEREIDEIRGKSESKLRPVELVTATLFSKLRKKWAPDVVLREERAEGSGIIEVVSGLESLHWLFGGWKLQQDVEDDHELTIDTESGGENKEYDQPIRTLEQDEFIIDADPELIAAIGSASEPTQEQINADRAAREEVEVDFYNVVVDGESRGEECACVNQSKRGYYLTWSGEGEYMAHVGELIGVNSRNNLDFDSSWSLGIIRWMRIQSSGLMGFGVELFEGDIESIRLDYRHTDTATNTIIGFQQKIKGRIDTIITKPFFFGENDKLLLTTVDGRVPVVPGQTIECTDAFMRFKIHFDSGAVDGVKQGSMKRAEAEDIFNSIWDDL